MSTARSTNPVDARGNAYVLGYLVVASMFLILWIGLYGLTFKGSSSGLLAAHHCAEISDEATRLACYDSTNHLSPRQPGRGYAPVIR